MFSHVEPPEKSWSYVLCNGDVKNLFYVTFGQNPLWPLIQYYSLSNFSTAVSNDQYANIGNPVVILRSNLILQTETQYPLGEGGHHVWKIDTDIDITSFTSLITEGVTLKYIMATPVATAAVPKHTECVFVLLLQAKLILGQTSSACNRTKLFVVLI